MWTRNTRPKGWTEQDEADADAVSPDLVDAMRGLIGRGYTYKMLVEVVCNPIKTPDPLTRAVSLLMVLRCGKWIQREFGVATAR